MTQNEETLEPVTPGQAVARRLREVRRVRGWSAQDLADRCEALGVPSLDRSTVANIENGRRQRVGVDELLVLALALGVAPVHLLVPLEEEWYAVAPEHVTGTSRVRQWVRGAYPMTGVPLTRDPVSRQADRETYRTQRPEAPEWEPPPEPTPEEEARRRQERIRHFQDLEEQGLVRITRHPDGAWSFTPVEQRLEPVDGEGDA